MKLRVVSTFNGRNNKFFTLWEKAKENGYSAHRVTIHDAIADGMPLDAEKLKRALDDPDAWAQEYECDPMDASSVLLSYELLAGCESSEASTLLPPEFWEGTFHAPLFMGLDFARKRDLSVAWTNAKLAGVDQTMEVLEMAKMSTPDQVNLLRPRIKKAQRITVDYTGPGIGMGDYLVEEFGEWNPARHLYGKVELVTFTNTAKLELFSKMRMAFERREVRIPISRTIREDLHSINRVVSAAGNVTYRAPHTDDGHADRATALSLAIRAATGIATSYSATLC
jgi:phage FluMu gp28-like protein